MNGRRKAATTAEGIGSPPPAAERPTGAREAPHRRRNGAPRVVERSAVLLYRTMEWLLGHLPARPTWIVGGLLTRAGYLVWPSRRRYVNANFAHVLGTTPDDPAVRRLALAAYRNYARYVVELMHLTSITDEVATARVDLEGIETFEEIRRRSSGLVLVGQHVGNNEAVAAGLARHGWPVSVVADDSTFPELFEHLRLVRRRLGVETIPWRNLREVFAVLKRGEMLGLLVDWGYKPDGVPVRLFDAPTMLPAGPAYLAAKTGATILPFAARRHRDGRFYVTHDEPFTVASADPLAIAEATQRIADALERTVAAAPDQWYSFKPIWPDGDEIERVAHAHRAVAREAGVEAR